MNYLMVIEYCGANYNGWQVQNGAIAKDKNKTIENEILKAIKVVTKFDVKLLVSGRTDAGVHALNQVANFKLPYYYDLNKLKIALNGIMPPDISVKNIEIAHDSFHATRDAVSKTYLYKINSGFKSPLLSGRSWFIKEDLNINLMKESSDIFLGKNNFFNFVKREKGKKSVNYCRVIKEIKICEKSYGLNIFIEGEGFLRNMVRRIVGSLILCGTGKINNFVLRDMLTGENRPFNRICAPSCGLFLYSVKYGHKIYS